MSAIDEARSGRATPSRPVALARWSEAYEDAYRTAQWRALRLPARREPARNRAESGRALRIALIAPLYEAVPPRLYGGAERIVAHLADVLVDLGHDVTLFASAEVRTRARLVPVRDQAIRLDPSPLKSDLAAHLAMLHDVRQHALEFDILHFHVFEVDRWRG